MHSGWTDRQWMAALTPGLFFAISNLAQSAIAAPGFFTQLGRVIALPVLFLLAYGLSALIFRAAIDLPRPWRVAPAARLTTVAAHIGYFLAASVVQLSAIAALTAFVREPETWISAFDFWLGEIVVSCAPIWGAVYISALAVLTWLSERPRKAAGENPRLELRDASTIHFVDKASVLLAESEGNYVRLTTSRGVLLPRLGLAELEARLPQDEFVRTHRTALVRKAMISAIERLPSGAYRVLLSSGAAAPLSRRRLDVVRRALSARETLVTS